MTFYLGIDPGKKGALAILNTDTNRIAVTDMPSTTPELHDFIAGLPIIKGCVLEKLHAGPVMGRTTIATMFADYGTLRGALFWRDIPFREERPSKWKPALNLSKNKNASRQMAMQVFPDDAEKFKLVKHDGRAEAALLALYAADSRRRWAA